MASKCLYEAVTYDRRRAVLQDEHGGVIHLTLRFYFKNVIGELNNNIVTFKPATGFNSVEVVESAEGSIHVNGCKRRLP